MKWNEKCLRTKYVPNRSENDTKGTKKCSQTKSNPNRTKNVTKRTKTSLKVNSVLERESSQPILTSILSNNFRNIKSVLFWDDFQLLTKLSKAIKIRANQFIFTKSEKI